MSLLDFATAALYPTTGALKGINDAEQVNYQRTQQADAQLQQARLQVIRDRLLNSEVAQHQAEADKLNREAALPKPSRYDVRLGADGRLMRVNLDTNVGEPVLAADGQPLPATTPVPRAGKSIRKGADGRFYTINPQNNTAEPVLLEGQPLAGTAGQSPAETRLAAADHRKQDAVRARGAAILAQMGQSGAAPNETKAAFARAYSTAIAQNPTLAQTPELAANAAWDAIVATNPTLRPSPNASRQGKPDAISQWNELRARMGQPNGGASAVPAAPAPPVSPSSPTPSASGSPVMSRARAAARAQELQRQGKSRDEILQTMRAEGYNVQ